jgi:hypothetical protein
MSTAFKNSLLAVLHQLKSYGVTGLDEVVLLIQRRLSKLKLSREMLVALDISLKCLQSMKKGWVMM